MTVPVPVGLDGFLVACLRQPDAMAPAPELVSTLRPADVASLPAAAVHHGVAPALHCLLAGSPDLPNEVLSALEQAHRSHWQFHLRVLGDLAQIAPVLDALSVPWVVLKGPVLAEVVYGRFDMRSYADLDLLVDRRGLPRVLEALEESGARMLDRNWTTIRAEVRGELNMTLRHETLLDLHWHLLNEPRVRRSFSLPIDEMLERRRRVSVNGIDTPTFDTSDTLIHLATHACLAGGYRLVWFKDLEQVVTREQPNWDEVVRRSMQSGVGLMVATMLGRLNRVLGTAVPPEVLDALAPRVGWRTIVSALDQASPPQRSYQRQLTGRTLVASTRRSTAASLAELRRAAFKDILAPILINPRNPWRRRLLRQGDPGPVPNPLHSPSGEGADRAAFLQLVSSSRVEP